MAASTRRDFIKQLAAAGGTLAAAPLVSFASNAGADPNAAMAIVSAAGEPLPEAEVDALAGRLTEKAIDTLGGMDRFVKQGDLVWIKPNIGWNRSPAQAANTNPEVVAALVRLCLDAGAKKVKVGDHSCHAAKQSYRRSGIAAAAKAAGGDVVFLDQRRFRDYDLGGKRLAEWPLYGEIMEADLIISAPVIKHHGLSKMTGCMKNYMGLIGGKRNAWHQDLSSCLRDITAYLKPRLSVLDAVRVLTDHGPQGGNPEDVVRRDTVVAGTDIVALDAWGAELLGHAPADIDFIRVAHEAGLGEMDYRKLAPVEVDLT
jgi:uncharacterized protein (DUF362 family)